jgi:hypothetical protein
MNYNLITDPGHGWLAVPFAELRSLGIAEQITHYSYLSRDGRTAYLEEDCDLSTFARAKGWKPGANNPITVVNCNHDAFVRSLPPFDYRRGRG